MCHKDLGCGLLIAGCARLSARFLSEMNAKAGAPWHGRPVILVSMLEMDACSPSFLFRLRATFPWLKKRCGKESRWTDQPIP